MAVISKTVNFDILEKLPDGTYKKKHPETKASQVIAEDGSNLENHLENNVKHITSAERNTWNGKQNSLTISSSVTSTSTTQVANSAAVRTAMNRADAAFQSASDGKSLIANAITGKGVTTSGIDTFSKMAENINQISTGVNVSPGPAIIFSLKTERILPSTTYEPTKVKQVTMLGGGIYRFSFSIASGGYWGRVLAQLYINGLPKGILRTRTNSTYNTPTQYVEDLSVKSGDVVQLYVHTESNGDYQAKEIRVYNLTVGVSESDLSIID